MSCRDVREQLANGKPLTEEAQQHVRTCDGCGPMMLALEQHDEAAEVSQASLERIASGLETELVAVRPLPSNLTLWSAVMAFFYYVSVALTLPFGFQGMAGLGAGERVAYYGVIFVVASLMAGQAVSAFIPGARRWMSEMVAVALTVGALGLVSVALFASLDHEQFVHRGIPCLRLGTASALITAVVGTILTRRGFASAPAKASGTAGVFAALVGIMVLAFHCPQKNALHIVVWHLGTILISGLAGMAIGWAFSRYKSTSFQRG